MHRTRHACLQILRRSIQIITVLLIVGLALVSLYAHYRAAHALDDMADLTGIKGYLLSGIDHAVSSIESPQSFLDGFKGTLWSMRIFGFDLTDPLAAAEMSFASKKFYLPLVMSCVFWIAVTLLLGRVFCSWICPGYLLFELSGKLRRLLQIAEVPPAEVSFSLKNKYIVLVIGLLFASFFSMPLFALIYPPAVLSRIAHAWIFGTAMTGMLVLIGIIIIFELFISPRWWCRSICPGGALYALIGWPRLVRVKLNSGRCIHCNKCQQVCEPRISPLTDSCSIECDNCGQCVRHCPEQALFYSFGLPAKNQKKTPNSSVAVSIVLVAIAVSICYSPSLVQAHHILGLPHYSYKENYPQAPTLEYPAQTGPYDVLLTSYPGRPGAGETANIAVYIKNRQTNKPYSQPVEIGVLQTFTFGRSRNILPRTQCRPFDNLHKVTVTFPEEGEYVIEISLDVEGKTETIPFVMIAGNPTATISVLIVIVLGVTIFLVIIRAIKIKQARQVHQKDLSVS